ncbi:MAG: response regulator [Negativicutes bacterium]|nr:response regulator [Negativicutes bacterium]
MKKAKLLLVDDQPTTIDQLRAVFADYDVDDANNGRMALKQLRENKPDLIILNTATPGIDGYSVLTIVKNSPDTHTIPIILTTAIAGAEDRTRSLEKGADDFLVKPLKLPELAEKVKSLLRFKVVHDELTRVRQLFVSMAKIMEDKSEYYAGHSQRVAVYAARLARKDLLHPLWMEEVRAAALLHDIGQIAVRESIFLKPGKLTAEEFEMVKTHPVAGVTMCAVLSVLKPVLPFIRHHHERFDGSGYPDRLKGSEIPLGARIIAVADGYDALTSERPYRRAFSPSEAMAILRDNSGSQWDPQLAELFCQMVETGTLQGEEDGKRA